MTRILLAACLSLAAVGATGLWLLLRPECPGCPHDESGEEA